MKSYRFILTFLFIFLSGCSASKIPSQALSLSPAATILPTVMPSPTDPLVETAVSHTTSLPALSAELAARKITDLLNGNKDCKLPCFWGIIPGQTTRAEAKARLDTFSFVDSGSHSNESSSMEYLFDVQGPDPAGLRLQLYLREDVIDFIVVSGFDSPSYHIAKFLHQNGEPDRILVRTWKDSPSGTGSVPFLLYMYYEDLGMLVGYDGNGTIENDSIHGCVERSPSLKLWGSVRPQSMEEAMQMVGWYDQNLHSISEATNGNMDVKTFSDALSTASSEPCFNTLREIWAGPER